MDRNSLNDLEPGNKSFCCPICGTVAQQSWRNSSEFHEKFLGYLKFQYYEYRPRVESYASKIIYQFCEFVRESSRKETFQFVSPEFDFCICSNCSETSVWFKEQLVYPRKISLPEPNSDLSDNAKEIFVEASKIFLDSPRASAALLRLCLESLCHQLGEKGSLGTCIGNLKSNNKLNSHILKALNYCGILGNHAVHDAGIIDLNDDSEAVEKLFFLINDIAYEMLTKPRELEERYASLKEKSRSK